MTTTNRPPATHHRQVGPAGTVARFLVGTALLASVIEGHVNRGFHLWPWILGLVGSPVAVTAWQRWHAHRHPERFQATGPAAHLLNIGLFLALYLTTWYAPSLSVTSDAALVFYGASMLLAAVRGSAGCEVLAVSNWVLHRDDQIGCALFAPIDHPERRRANSHHLPRP